MTMTLIPLVIFPHPKQSNVQTRKAHPAHHSGRTSGSGQDEEGKRSIPKLGLQALRMGDSEMNSTSTAGRSLSTQSNKYWARSVVATKVRKGVLVSLELEVDPGTK